MPREPFREQDAEEQIVDLYRRLDRVEAGMVRAEDGSLVPASFYDPPPGPEPKTLIASKPGRLRDGIRSTPFTHPEGAGIVTIRFELDVPGETSTVIAFEKNGEEVTPVVSTGGDIDRRGRFGDAWRAVGVGAIPAGYKVSTVYFEGLRLAPLIDSFVMEITSTGDGAAGLTALVTFAR